MMQDYSFLWDIVSDLGEIWGEDSQRKTWSILGQTSMGNVNESQRRVIVRARLEQYRTRLEASTPTQLLLNAKIRASELGQLYQQSVEYWPSLNADGLPLFTENMIRTLRDLTIGYAAASVIAYYLKGLSLNLPDSIRADGDALATSAVAQGLTDKDSFLGILNASTNERRNQGQPQQKRWTKDVILNNPTAVSLLKKMQDAGLLDADYQWNGAPTKYEMGAFAKEIADEARIGRYWASTFADLWPSIEARQLSRGKSEGVHSDFTGDARKVLGLDTT